jgi:protein-S-isoprenylcysteine O-methyltransferase Ste14
MSSLNRQGIRGIIVQSIIVLLAFVILFVSAGTLAWINGWIFVGLISILWVIHIVIMVRTNPEMLNERGSVIKKGTKGFDRINLIAVPVLTLVSVVVMALDAGRFHWSFMPLWLSILGTILLVLGLMFGTWAMSVNKFFEWTVRIQSDKQQYVCTSGPYRMIRHPGYTGYIVERLAYPLILGSWWGFLPEGILAIMFIVRTALEDRTLQNELQGYKEYAEKVKYRLIPLIW